MAYSCMPAVRPPRLCTGRHGPHCQSRKRPTVSALALAFMLLIISFKSARCRLQPERPWERVTF